MYRPLINKVLVEIDDKDASWGKTTDENIGGVAYREGKVLEVGLMTPTGDYPETAENMFTFIDRLSSKDIMWHEGHEAGTVFEENSKKYALIFWWDIIGVKE